MVQKQAIASLDTSCYTVVPKRRNQEFAGARTSLSLTDIVKILGMKTSVHLLDENVNVR